jgi:hypothetical protein
VKWGGKGPNWDLGANLAVNEGLTWDQMPDKECNRYCGTVRDLGDLLDMWEVGWNWWDRGQTWGRSGSWG